MTSGRHTGSKFATDMGMQPGVFRNKNCMHHSDQQCSNQHTGGCQGRQHPPLRQQPLLVRVHRICHSCRDVLWRHLCRAEEAVAKERGIATAYLTSLGLGSPMGGKRSRAHQDANPCSFLQPAPVYWLFPNAAQKIKSALQLHIGLQEAASRQSMCPSQCSGRFRTCKQACALPSRIANKGRRTLNLPVLRYSRTKCGLCMSALPGYCTHPE